MNAKRHLKSSEKRNKKTLILLSGKAGSGKDTFYSILNKHISCSRYALADPIKTIAKSMFDWNGEKDEKGRKLLIDIGQYLGCEKDDIDENIKNKLDKVFSRDMLIWPKTINLKIMPSRKTFSIITDWRMIKELEYFKIFFDKIYTIRINRDTHINVNDFKTESELDDFNFDFIIDNNGTIDDFEEKIKDLKRRMADDN